MGLIRRISCCFSLGLFSRGGFAPCQRRYFYSCAIAWCLIWSAPLPQLRAEELARVVHEDIVVGISDTPEGLTVSITASDASEPKVFSLAAPNRVVIDIPGRRFETGATIQPAPNPLIDSIRFGVHPDKARIVLDITSADVPPTSFVSSGGGSGALQLPISADLRARFAAERTTAVVAASTAPAREVIPPTTDQSATAAAVSDVKSPLTGPAPVEIQELSAITFEQLSDGTSAVRLSLRQRPTYSFQKADKRSYRFTLRQSGVAGDHLHLPFYPPADSRGLTVVEARRVGESLEVLVGVEEGYRIGATTAESAIVVRAIPLEAPPVP